eukprot:4133899-Pyramimonas_sp.AAC.1
MASERANDRTPPLPRPPTACHESEMEAPRIIRRAPILLRLPRFTGHGPETSLHPPIALWGHQGGSIPLAVPPLPSACMPRAH